MTLCDAVCMQFTQYLSDCGGVLGLWLGMSLLTIFEFVEFALDISVLVVSVCVCVRGAGMLTRPAGHEAEAEARRSEAED